jgi:hypothetical protein
MYQRLHEKNIKEECTGLAKGALQCFSCRLELSQLRRSFQQHSHHHIINIIKNKIRTDLKIANSKDSSLTSKGVILVYDLEYLYKSFETNNANKSPKDHDQIHNIC